MLIRVLPLVALVLAATLPSTAETKERVALIIGNSGYQRVPKLSNPANDATDIASALKRLDFEVILALDADDQQMRQLFREFAHKAENAELTFVYFAGHGIEVNKANYLIPVNAELATDLDVEFETIPLDLVMRSLAMTEGIKIVLIDACRDNPFAKQLIVKGGSRSVGTGLVRVDPIGGVLPGGILVGYAAREGSLAFDGTGRNSPYAQALLEHLEEPGLEVSKFFRKVRDRVFELTDGAQEPFTYGALPGDDIYFLAPQNASVKNTALTEQETVRQSEILRRFALAEKSADASVWNRFIDDFSDYPDHELVVLAHRKRDFLESVFLKRKRKFVQEPWIDVDYRDDGITPILTAEQRKLVQTSLNFMGFDPGPADGVFGPKTRNAIGLARGAADLWPSSKVDRSLLEILVDPFEIEDLMSERARSYMDIQLPPTAEPRLAQALKVLQFREILFDYYQGRLYIGVLPLQGHDTWHQAGRIAKRAGGHLVTISDRAENDFVFDLFAKDDRFFLHYSGFTSGPYIGLYQLDKTSEPNGGWTWVDGNPLTYENFAQGQPDNFENGQHYGVFFSRRNGGLESTWADMEDTHIPVGFVIEIE